MIRWAGQPNQQTPPAPARTRYRGRHRSPTIATGSPGGRMAGTPSRIPDSTPGMLLHGGVPVS